MNRFSLVLVRRLLPHGRSQRTVPSCQRYHASSTLNHQHVNNSTAYSVSQNNRVVIDSSRALQTGAESVLADDSAVPVKDFSEIPGPNVWRVKVLDAAFEAAIDAELFADALELGLLNVEGMKHYNDFDTTQIHVLWASLFREYGPIVKLKVPGMPPFVASLNPNDLEVFLKSTMNNPIREAFQSLKKIRDNAKGNYFKKKAGLLPENGEEWWRLRSRVQGPLLRPKNVAAYLPKVDQATLAYMDRIELLQEKTGQVPDNFLEDLYKWALECVGLVALNKELGCLDPDLAADSVPMQMIGHINDMFSAMNETEMGPHTWKLFRSSAYVKLETAHNAFLEIADKSIQEASRSLDEAKAKGDPNRELTVMETFLNTEGISRSDMATMVLDMLFAGVDTTSHTVAFTLYLLARNPETQKKLQQEVDSVLGNATELLPDHIADMTYLNHVVRESLRIYPLTIGNARKLTDDIVMSGYKVPAGNIAMGFNMLISRDEKYFPRPNDFLPERWDRDRPYGPIHPFASLPFSHGKRMCIGKRIAEQEIYAFLIRAMQKYSVTFESQQQMEVKTQLVLKPNIPLPFKFHPRK